MGILNVTPDSFSDGGRHSSLDLALRRAWEMVEEGADIIDVGGESTRPGAPVVSLNEELDRVLPVVRGLARRLPVPLSVDTRHYEVMRLCLAEGATIINDINALRSPGALDLVAQSEAAVCLMHMRGEPESMQYDPVYENVVDEVESFLLQRAQVCKKAGIGTSRILIDPGIGFGKTLGHNLTLLKATARLASHGYPLLLGLSRKSFIGSLLDQAPVESRLSGSIGAAIAGALQGARLLRVHDVVQTREALQVACGLCVEEPTDV